MATRKIPGLKPADARTMEPDRPAKAPGVTSGKGAPRKTQRVRQVTGKASQPAQEKDDEMEYLVTEFRKLLEKVKRRRAKSG